MLEKGFQIADLIVAFIRGEISREGLKVLDEWLAESEENKVLFVSLMDDAVFKQYKQKSDQKKLTVIFNQIKIRKQRRQNWLRICRISAVAASIVVILVMWIMFRPQANQSADINNSGILVGKQMAYLVLSNGEQVILQEKQKDTITTESTHRHIILNDGRVKIESKAQDTLQKEEYHILQTPRGAEYNLTLADGTKVWLNADSRLKFPDQFNTSKRYVELTGEAYFEVCRDEIRPFIVHTNDIDVKVLGTEFCIRSYGHKPTLATLVKGSVEVTDQFGWQAILTPGQQSVTVNGNTQVRPVETIYYTAWKDGYFIFENAPLEEIMEELALWYNCQYFFQNPAVSRIRITARLKKYDEIDVLLGILSKTNEVEMEKKGNAILIRQK